MASFKDLNTIANDALFQGRCMYALYKASIDVMNEEGNIADHNARADFARSVLSGNVSNLRVALATLTNATIAAEADVAQIASTCAIPDGDIQFTVNSMFNALAGLANK